MSASSNPEEPKTPKRRGFPAASLEVRARKKKEQQAKWRAKKKAQS